MNVHMTVGNIPYNNRYGIVTAEMKLYKYGARCVFCVPKAREEIGELCVYRLSEILADH
jgi:hypothetical protein